MIELIFNIVGAITMFLIFGLWLAYGLAVIYLAMKGWRRTVWHFRRLGTMKPKRTIVWQKTNEAGRVVAEERSFRRAWAAESKLQRLWKESKKKWESQ